MEQRQQQSPPELRKVTTWLRNKAGMKTKTGILNGKRVEYFKGKSAIKAVQSPAYAKLKGVPKVEDEEQAINLLKSVIPFAFYLRVDRGNSVTPTNPQGVKGPSMKMLQINQMQTFTADDFFVWFLEGSQIKTVLGGILMVAVILAGVMFPLWPTSLRIGVWYLSMAMLGVIGLFFGLAIFRLILYVLTIVIAKPGIWIFPNLFADVGFVDSFIPGWDWDLPPPKKTKKKKGEGKESKKAKKSAGSSRAATPSQGVSTAVESSDLANGSAGGGKEPSVKISELSD